MSNPYSPSDSHLAKVCSHCKGTGFEPLKPTCKQWFVEVSKLMALFLVSVIVSAAAGYMLRQYGILQYVNKVKTVTEVHIGDSVWELP